MMSRQFALLLSILFLLPLRAQELRLSNRFVNDIAVDKDNLVWVATEEGLHCFDGIRTRAFLKQTSGLPANLVNDVLVDRTAPRVWAALQKGGLACYDKRNGTFRFFRAGDGEDVLSDDDITHLEQGPDGSVWASSFTAGIDRLDPETGEITPFNAGTFAGYRDAPLHTFAIQGDRLILGYWADGLSILSLNDHSRVDLRHDPQDPTSLPSDYVRALLVDSNNRLWVGTTQGLALYSEARGIFTVFRHRDGIPDSLPDNEIFSLEEDSQGQLLVAAGQGGVALLDIREAGAVPADASFSVLTGPELRERVEVRSVRCDRFGNLWIGTYGEGLVFQGNRATGAGRMDTPVPQGVPGLGADAILAEMTDADGRRWIGTADRGLYVEEKGRYLHPELPGRQAPAVRVFLEDGPAVWVGTDYGLYCLDRSTRRVLRHILREDSFPADMVRAIVRDASGYLWVGTYGKGLAVYNADLEMIAKYDAATGLGGDTVNALFCDSRERIWAATTAGLACFTAGPYLVPQLFSFQDGLPDENIRALAEDPAGGLWMSTYNSICCRTAAGKFLMFDSRDGLPDGNYYPGAVRVSPDGRIQFDSTDGTGWVDPETLLAEKPLPEVIFLNTPSELVADYRNNNLLVRFRVPDFSLSRSVEYAYRIPDLDPEWHPCGQELDFHHLPYGRHDLQVRARLHAQDWGDRYSSATLDIRPPFWLTWWAKGLYLLLVLGLITALAIRLGRRISRKNQEWLQQDRLLQERRVNEERMVFYTNITHELRTPLTLILGPLEDLSADDTVPAAARMRIGKVKQSARQLLELVNQILEFRKTETRNRELTVSYGNLSRFVEELGTRFRDLSTDKSVRFNVAVEPDVHLWFDAEAVTIILNNLLSNARKYTPSGDVVLSLRRQGDKVAVCVSDTGCGIPAEDLQHIFERYYQVKGPHQASGTGVGLALVKNLCDLHAIDLQVRSEVGQGSEFELLFDPAEDYPEARHEGPAPAVPEPEPELPEEPGRCRILVIEDNADILEYIQESLAQDFSVLTATNGREGLKIAVREIPDIIVSDIMMPVMDGIAMCKAIRQDVRTSHIPVVLLTAKGSDEAREEGYGVGADSYLVKPFNKSLLLSRLRNLLEKRDRTSHEVSESGSASDLSPVDNDFLQRYTRFVEEHLSDEKIDIASLAGEFAMSQSTLYRKVKAVSGLSPNELIRNLRLGKAADLLLRSDLTISEISWQTGFGSPVYFRSCFKERYGVTPSDYRENKGRGR